jgi:subtilisin family serine protease
MVAQFRDTTSNEGKLRVRKEFGVDVIDSCVCGAIELWAFPDTLNQIEMENLGTGTRRSSAQASSKAELLSADPNYALLEDTTGGTQRSPNFTSGSSAARPTLVAIIDSGVDYDNPNLRNRIWVKSRETDNDGIDDDSDCEIDNGWGWNYLDRNNITFDDHGHGTAVATVVGGYSPNNFTYNNSANDDLGIVPYKYTDKAGRGTVFHAACALRHAADYRETLNNGHVARVRVINTSWGYYGEPCIVLENAILYAGDLCDVLIVASAGNKGLNTQIDSAKHWPSNSPFVEDTTIAYNDNVLSVGAFDANNEDVLAVYSNFSPKHIDMLANGTTQTYVPGNYVNMETKIGTSFSAPEVARAAGLLFQEFPNATAGAVKYALMMGVDTLQSADSLKIKSGGRLNYTKARQILGNIINPTLCDEEGFVVAVEAINSNTEKPLAKVFPNPFSQNLSIEFDAQVFDMNEPIDIQIVDVSGVSRFRQQIVPQYLHSLQLNELSSGLYLLSITQGAKKQMLKVVKF